MRVCHRHLLTVIMAWVVVDTLQAQPGPTMEITWTNFVSTSGNQPPNQVFRYTIRNTSAPSPTNNLFYFTIPVGIDSGLFYTWFDESPLDWEAWYGGSSTLFANTNTPISPGSATTLEVRAQSLVTRFAYATALAVGQYPPQPPGPLPRPAFTPVLVPVPAGPYPPPTLTELIVNSNTVTLTAQGLRVNSSYTLEQSATLTGWTHVCTFWPTNLTHTLSLPLTTNAPAQFFRLHWP